MLPTLCRCARSTLYDLRFDVGGGSNDKNMIFIRFNAITLTISSMREERHWFIKWFSICHIMLEYILQNTSKRLNVHKENLSRFFSSSNHSSIFFSYRLKALTTIYTFYEFISTHWRCRHSCARTPLNTKECAFAVAPTKTTFTHIKPHTRSWYSWLTMMILMRYERSARKKWTVRSNWSYRISGAWFDFSNVHVRTHAALRQNSTSPDYHRHSSSFAIMRINVRGEQKIDSNGIAVARVERMGYECLGERGVCATLRLRFDECDNEKVLKLMWFNNAYR